MPIQEQLTPWQPTTDPLTLAILGKALEEVSELARALTRCVIQGIEHSEPVTDKSNRQWLEEEIADVHATLHLVNQHFQLSGANISHRIDRKLQHLRAWHSLIQTKDGQ